MAKKIVVLAPLGTRVRIVRRQADGSLLAEPTHDLLPLWEERVFVNFMEVHITRVLSGFYGQDICWDYAEGASPRDIVPATGALDVVVHLPGGGERQARVRRIGGQTLAVQERERVFSL